MLEKIVNRVSSGIEIDGLRAYSRNVKPCGLKDTLLIDMYLDDGSSKDQLLCLLACSGKPPHYRSWLEIFCINSRPIGREYFDTPIEDEILKTFTGFLDPGDKVFIEYYSDRETASGLALGFPPAVTRLGFKLFSLDFSWFKDWYFSEGGHEGGQKLQAEKPLHKRSRDRHLMVIEREILSFVERYEDILPAGKDKEYLRSALLRSKKILIQIGAVQKDAPEQRDC